MPSLGPALQRLGAAIQMPSGYLVIPAPSAPRLRGEASVEPTVHLGCRAHLGHMDAAPHVLTFGLGQEAQKTQPPPPALPRAPDLSLSAPAPLVFPVTNAPPPTLLSHPHSEAPTLG